MDTPTDVTTLNQPPSSQPKVVQVVHVDPKILTKALQKLKGLVRGNGFDENNIKLCEAPEETSITMYRFKARTSLKLVPQYGLRVEPGRNTHCEVAANEVEFKKAIARIAIDAREKPEKRKQIIDFIFSKSNKGFGIKEQRIPFQQLNRSLVQHERCATCNNKGRTSCATCHGDGQVNCTRCNGRKQMICPQCKGSTHTRTNDGRTISCQFCRGDGRINCTLCAARGQIKCQKCAATGSLPCKICAGSGWLSHIANIEIFAQIKFTFEQQGLPPLLVKTIEKNPSKCVEKHDIEVSIDNSTAAHNSFVEMGKDNHDITNNTEPDDTIWLDYEALCPFGPITFDMGGEKKSGSLFGFQSRLINFPFFMDSFTKDGKDALIMSSKDHKNARAHLSKAVKFRLISDIITQTLLIKNPKRTKIFLVEKYTTGVSPESISEMVNAADVTLRNITRLWRVIGLVIGLALFTALLDYYFIEGGRMTLGLFGPPESALTILDIISIPLGIFIGVISSKWAAKWSQNKTLHGIVANDILQKTLPNTGMVFQWAVILSTTIFIILLTIAVILNLPSPDWLSFIVMKILAITHAG